MHTRIKLSVKVFLNASEIRCADQSFKTPPSSYSHNIFKYKGRKRQRQATGFYKSEVTLDNIVGRVSIE